MIQGTGIVLFNKEGKILLQHRDEHAPVYPLQWAFFGGRVEKKETPLQTIKRECLEELGYVLEEPLLIYEGHLHGNFYSFIYLEEYDSSKELDQKEGDKMGWFSIGGAKELDHCFSSGEIFDIIAQYL